MFSKDLLQNLQSIKENSSDGLLVEDEIIFCGDEEVAFNLPPGITALVALRDVGDDGRIGKEDTAAAADGGEVWKTLGKTGNGRNGFHCGVI